MAEQAGAEHPPAPLRAPEGRVPPVVVRADLASAFAVASALAVLGIALGRLWASLAPARRMRVVADDGRLATLPLEGWHRFDGLAMFLLLGLAAGLVTGVALWLLRSRRGPVLLLGAVVGSLLSAWLALRTGVAFADAAHTVPGTPRIGSVVARAPVLETAWVVLAQPFGAAVSYGMAAAWNARDDLGRRT
ncbi:DUF2567 domain-containing protein [Saccharomonospora iraqiensis]|uniref:DUF2567 domain-containing protein n=1 Tax=Saccharomonospora iraqiensis TaxID=52698 RepID=UPI00022DE961|nr:DUF2567 domain-containing protein [Saccharomonospora iraqiensis]